MIIYIKLCITNRIHICYNRFYYICKYEYRIWFGIVELEIRFSFVSALTISNICDAIQKLLRSIAIVLC